jgi:subfamily B ATP-binding cassette protein MsbA
MTQPATSQPPGSLAIYVRLLRHVRPYLRWFALAILFLVVFAASQAAIPALLKPMLDGTFVDRDPRFLFWAPFGIVALFSVRGLANFASQVAFSWVSSRVVYDLRDLMFQRYLQLPTAFYDDHPTGNLISRVTFDTTRVASSATTVLTTLIRDSLTLVGLIGYILYLDWQLSLIVFCLFPVIAYLVMVLSRRLRRVHRRLQADYSEMTSILEEAIRGHKVIKVFGGEAYESQRFQQASNWVRRLQMKAQVATMVSVPATEILSALVIATIVYLSTSSGQNTITVGGFMAFITALVLMMPAIKNLTKLNGELQMGLAAAESVFQLIDEPPEANTGTRCPAHIRGEIAFHRVSFRYANAARHVLSELSLHIPAGTSLALVGASGSGKTTAAALVARFYPLHSGSITIDGIDINELALSALRRQISYVGQDTVLFNDNIANNISYGLAQKPDMASLRRAAKAAHALEFIDKLADGFDSRVGENGVKLSGGQRQRIAIARAILKQAPLLILDEATSALDSESEKQVQAALDNLRKERTTLIIAHRLSTVENADQILVLEDGRVREAGTHQQLIGQNGAYAALYRQQAGPLADRQQDERS